jgi:hypothetical protein
MISHHLNIIDFSPSSCLLSSGVPAKHIQTETITMKTFVMTHYIVLIRHMDLNILVVRTEYLERNTQKSPDFVLREMERFLFLNHRVRCS